MGRNGTLEYARLIAAFGIVFFHAKAPGAAIGYAALPFFLILLILMAIPAAGKQSFGPYLTGRASRLLIPWVIWSAVYGALKLVEVRLTDATLASEFSLSMLLTGPALHLWFLPFAFAACLLLHPVVALIQKGSGIGLAAVFGAATIAAILVQQSFDLSPPLSQWCYGLPAVFLGLALASLPAGLSFSALFLAAFGGIAMLIGATEGLAQLLLAAAAFIFCVALPTADTPLARRAGAAAMGVYLAHPLLLSVLTRGTPIPEHSLLLALLACLGALILTLAIDATKGILQQSRLKSSPPTHN